MYGVVWKHEEHGKIMSAPESFEGVDSAEKAKVEGRTMLSELPHEHRSIMKPLSVVEVTDQMVSTLQGCERIYIPNEDDDGELEFIDVSSTQFWSSQPWWLK